MGPCQNSDFANDLGVALRFVDLSRMNSIIFNLISQAPT